MTPDTKVLVAKDNIPLRHLIEKYLQSMECQTVLHAENGLAALKRLEEEEVDLIISDWQMPELDGVELFKKLQAHPDWSKIPFLMISSNREYIEDALAEGIEHYITIPFARETLCQKVEELLNPR